MTTRTQMQIVATFSLLTASQSVAVEVFVAPDGSGDYPTIQAAINAAGVDTVSLMDGVYRGDGNRDIDFGGRGTFLRSLGGAEVCILDCEGAPGDPHRGFLFESGEATAVIVGLTVRGGYVTEEYGGGAVLTLASAPTFESCVFVDNESMTQGGGVATWGTTDGGSYPRIYDCEFRGNSAVQGGGLYAVSPGIEVYDCLFTGNVASGDGGGIYADNGISLSRATIAGNRAGGRGGGTYFRSAGGIRGSVLWGNCAEEGDDAYIATAGWSPATYCSVVDLDRVAGPGGLDTEDCTDEDPQFCDPIACDMAPTSGGDYRVAEGSVCLPDRSPCGSPIGGQGEGCPATPVRRESWAGLKATFTE